MWAFYYLKKQDSYEDSIRNILSRGGDTDTNAAIVGGLLGAYYGIHRINQNWIEKVILFRCQKTVEQKTFIDRPDFLVPRFNLISLVKGIAVNSPNVLKLNSDEEIDKKEKELYSAYL